jgi:hypothetical protein
MRSYWTPSHQRALEASRPTSTGVRPDLEKCGICGQFYGNDFMKHLQKSHPVDYHVNMGNMAGSLISGGTASKLMQNGRSLRATSPGPSRRRKDSRGSSRGRSRSSSRSSRSRGDRGSRRGSRGSRERRRKVNSKKRGGKGRKERRSKSPGSRRRRGLSASSADSTLGVTWED